MANKKSDDNNRPGGSAAGAKTRSRSAGTKTTGTKTGGGKGRRAAETKTDEEDHVVDLEEELHPDDVEDPLDVLLKEKTASEGLDADEAEVESDDVEPGERSANRIAPRQADEFLCSSCFLVLPLSQLADEKRQLCRDCA